MLYRFIRGKGCDDLQLIREEISSLWNVIGSMKFPNDYIDIVLVAILLYYGIKLIRDARAGQLLKGIVVIFVITQVAQILNLSAVSYIVNALWQYGFLAIIVVFQPELRTVLEKVGRTNLRNINIFNTQKNDLESKMVHVVNQVCDSCKELSVHQIGALIVFERATKLGDIINTGISLDAEVSSQMIGTIFFPNTPLHDGAVVVRDNRIAAAGCLLPLSQKMEISSQLGTRHRAAVGVGEVSDAFAIVVSEESGHISYAQNGEIVSNITAEELKQVLLAALTSNKSENLDGKEIENA